MKTAHTTTRLSPWTIPLAALAVSFCASLLPAARAAEPVPAKRIYIALDDHTDYMWTADEACYRQAFQEMIDFYLDDIEWTAKLPKNEQWRPANRRPEGGSAPSTAVSGNILWHPRNATSSIRAT